MFPCQEWPPIPYPGVSIHLNGKSSLFRWYSLLTYSHDLPRVHLDLWDKLSLTTDQAHRFQMLATSIGRNDNNDDDDDDKMVTSWWHFYGKVFTSGILHVLWSPNGPCQASEENSVRSENNIRFYWKKLQLSQLMRLWHVSSSVNSFFKCACTVIQWG